MPMLRADEDTIPPPDGEELAANDDARSNSERDLAVLRNELSMPMQDKMDCAATQADLRLGNAEKAFRLCQDRADGTSFSRTGATAVGRAALLPTPIPSPAKVSPALFDKGGTSLRFQSRKHMQKGKKEKPGHKGVRKMPRNAAVQQRAKPPESPLTKSRVPSLAPKGPKNIAKVRPKSGRSLKVQNIPPDHADGAATLAIFREAGATSMDSIFTAFDESRGRRFSFAVCASASELLTVWNNLSRLTFHDNAYAIVSQALYNEELKNDRPALPEDCHAVPLPDGPWPKGRQSAGHVWHDTADLAEAHAIQHGSRFEKVGRARDSCARPSATRVYSAKERSSSYRRDYRWGPYVSHDRVPDAQATPRRDPAEFSPDIPLSSSRPYLDSTPPNTLAVPAFRPASAAGVRSSNFVKTGEEMYNHLDREMRTEYDQEVEERAREERVQLKLMKLDKKLKLKKQSAHNTG